jgi:hypothetical protein
MISTNSPLEHLAAFGIVCVASVLSTVCLGKYIEKMKNNALRVPPSK